MNWMEINKAVQWFGGWWAYGVYALFGALFYALWLLFPFTNEQWKL